MIPLSRVICRYPGRVLAIGILLTLPCVYWTTLLYSHLKLDLEELLPRKAQSVQDLDEVRARLKTTENLAILVFSDQTDASRRFVDDLAVRLRGISPEILYGVEHEIRDEVRFFERRKALFIELEDLKALRDYVQERLDYEKALYNPLNIFSEIDVPEPRFGLRRFLLKYKDQDQAARFSRYPHGYYASRDERKRALLVSLPANQSTVKGRLRLKSEVENVVRAMKPERYAMDLRIHYSGEVQNNIDEFTAVLHDIERSATFVTVAVVVALLVYFRTILGVLSLVVSLVMARFWAFGLIWFQIGFLNANSAFMGSIVLGSGITFGVMLLSRYLEERRAMKPAAEAAQTAIEQSAHATWTAALAAGLAYGSLGLTEFEGFRQYGLIGFVAMLFCWASAFVLLPAMLLLLERIHPLVSERAPGNRHHFFKPIMGAISGHPRIALGASLILTVASTYLLSRSNGQPIIEMDLSRLRSRDSMLSGSGYWAREQNEIFRSYLSPMIVLSRSEKEAHRIATLLRTQMRDNGAESLMTSARSIHDFVPDRQKEKIRVLREIKLLLPSKMLRRLPTREQKLAKSLLAPESMRPFGQRDLPRLIRDKFTEKNGVMGRLVLVEPPLNSAAWTFDQLDRFVSNIRATAASDSGTRIPVAGNQAVTRDMFKAIIQDGPRATLAAILAVSLLVTVLFRRALDTALVLGCLILGVFWMAGATIGTGLKINFLNFIVLPIAFGIGVDYAVNILERYRNDPEHDVQRALRETGSAVTLCSFTTIMGYVSLIIADNRAFVSFGLLAVAAELGTMLAAIMTLPSILLLIERRRMRRQALPATPQEVPETTRKAA